MIPFGIAQATTDSETFMLIDPKTLSPNRLYHTMIQTIIPRPIAWVLSDNGVAAGAENQFNLAPFSYFSPVSSEPPVLMISVGKKPDGSLKDTRANISERKHFVVHIADSHMAECVTASSATLAHGDSEVKQLGLALEAFADFSLPRLSCCNIAYACELLEIKEIGSVPQAIIFGEVKHIYIADHLIEEQNGRTQVNALKIDPLARLGGDEYWVKGKKITVKRPL
jgi:flavin reductase (DIM6/NTAB) family NADH-FMN oxidoreductase RutF